MIFMKVQCMTEKYQKPPKTEATMTKKAKVTLFSTYSSPLPCRIAAGKKYAVCRHCYSVEVSESLFVVVA